MRLDQVEQSHAIFECTVHALAVKWHDGVRGIADQQCAVALVPAWAAQGAQHADRVGCVLLDKVRHQGQRVRKFPQKQRARRAGIRQRCKTRVPLIGQKQRGGKATVGIGQRNQHVAAARPDMQRGAIKLMLPLTVRRYAQFLVTVIEHVDVLAEWRSAIRN